MPLNIFSASCRSYGDIINAKTIIVEKIYIEYRGSFDPRGRHRQPGNWTEQACIFEKFSRVGRVLNNIALLDVLTSTSCRINRRRLTYKMDKSTFERR